MYRTTGQICTQKNTSIVLKIIKIFSIRRVVLVTFTGHSSNTAGIAGGMSKWKRM